MFSDTLDVYKRQAQNFREVYRVLKPGGTFFICNEANGETAKDDKWTQIINGCLLYTSTYDTGSAPTLFSGDLSESIGAVFQNIGKRFTFGGEAPMDQRIYYFCLLYTSRCV